MASLSKSVCYRLQVLSVQKRRVSLATSVFQPTQLAERTIELSRNIYNQLQEKAKHFSAYSVALDESTDITDTAQLAICIRGIDDNFEVIEELLTVMPMHGQTTAQDIFRQLCNAIVDAGLPWQKFAGITTDGAPSMTGRKNGLVALVQKN